MTLISEVTVPDDIWKKILNQTISSAQDVSTYKLVCANFNKIIEDKVYLQTLLVKIKGEHYSDPIYSHDPRKFFNLDWLITKTFKSIYADNSATYKERVKQWKDISTIALRNLERGIFILTYEAAVTKNFVGSEDHIKQLQELDFTHRDKWQQCINAIANDIATSIFPIQLEIKYSRNYLLRILNAFHHPNSKMAKLIEDHEIKKVYFADPSSLIIEHMNEEEIQPLELQEAVLSPEEHKQKLNDKLIQDLFHNLKFELVGNQIHFKSDKDRKESLLKRLKDTATGQKAHIDEYYSHAPCLFIFGHLFPEIWPNVIKNMLQEDCRDAVNYWLTARFKNSIPITTTETKDTNNDVSYDPDLKNCMLVRLKDPSSFLKRDIEEKCTEEFLHFCKEIFPEIWPN